MNDPKNSELAASAVAAAAPCSAVGEAAVIDASKVLVVACLVNNSEHLRLDIGGFHGPLGESGDWVVICRKKRRFWPFR